jgi:hypothetical protein
VVLLFSGASLYFTIVAIKDGKAYYDATEWDKLLDKKYIDE